MYRDNVITYELLRVTNILKLKIIRYYESIELIIVFLDLSSPLASMFSPDLTSFNNCERFTFYWRYGSFGSASFVLVITDVEH